MNEKNACSIKFMHLCCDSSGAGVCTLQISSAMRGRKHAR